MYLSLPCHGMFNQNHGCCCSSLYLCVFLYLSSCSSSCLFHHPQNWLLLLFISLHIYQHIYQPAYPSDPEIAFSDPMGANTSSTCYLYTNVSLYLSLYLYLCLYSFHQHNLLHGKLLLSQVSQISQVFATSTSCK